jgi:aryl-alcohol dehydrogenase-like predicted oxidoreductase
VPTMPRRLGAHGPEVLPIGLGLFGFSNAYGPASSAEAEGTIHRALDIGCTLLDTADVYGGGENEEWLGRALRGRREQAVLCTKVGFVWDETGKATGRDGSPKHIREAAEASLRRLQTDVIDLYTLHRVDPAVPIEETVGAMAELVQAGKIRVLGLSEATAEQVERAHAVHPIATLQSEYSLWTRDPEQEILPLCEKLGIALVAFSPLGRGMFAGSGEKLAFESEDFRSTLPRFQAENLEKNLKLTEQLRGFAAHKGCTSGQVALAWILHSGPNTFAIPGTRKQKHLEDNFGALQVELTADEMEELNRMFAPEHVAGARYTAASLFRPEHVPAGQ